MTRMLGSVSKLGTQVITSGRLIALAMLVTFTLAAMQPAQAQSSDTWKSVAIIGGSTAAGAYVGHKIAGPTGAWIGAGVGATAGYAIDRKRRENEYYNQAENGNYDPNSGYYGNGGPYGNSGPYANSGPYGNSGPYANTGPYGNGGSYQNGGYYRDGAAYPDGSPYQGNNTRSSQRSRR